MTDPRLVLWSIWRFQNREGPRPATPTPIPPKWWLFLAWAGARRRGRRFPLPFRVPDSWWAALREINRQVPPAVWMYTTFDTMGIPAPVAVVTRPAPVRVSAPLWDLRSCYVANPYADPATLVSLGFELVYVKIAHGIRPLYDPLGADQGTEPAEKQLANIYSMVVGLRAAGLRVAGWAWATGDMPDREGRYGALRVIALGLEGFVGNLEKDFDTFGKYDIAVADPTSPEAIRLARTRPYFEGVRAVIGPDFPLACTVLPRWAGDHDALRWAKCSYQPQAFGLENQKWIGDVVEHGEASGWNRADIRPCVQAYCSPAGEWPDVKRYVQEAKTYGVRLVPYPVEQAMNDEGLSWLRAIREAL